MSQVAYASAGGFAAVRSFKQQETARTNGAKAREVLAAMVADQRRLAPYRPKHCRGLEQHSREWFEACDRAFQEAMEAAGYVRFTGKTQLNAMGSTR